MTKTKNTIKSKTILGFNKVEVLGHPLTIKETNNVEELIMEDGDTALGIYKPKDSIIVLSTNQSKVNLEQTFYHELLHAIDWLSHNEEFKYTEEAINVLGRGLSTVRIIKHKN